MTDRTVEIVSERERERQRRWSIDEKFRLVAQTYEPGACVRQVAASHDVYPGLLFTWRRLVREGTLARLPRAVFLAVRALRQLQDLVP